MNYIVLKICCRDCMHFEELFIINADNLLELKKILKAAFDLDYTYIIYDIDGTFICYY